MAAGTPAGLGTEFASTVRDRLAVRLPNTDDAAAHHASALWAEVSDWAGIGAPASHGGAGGTPVDLGQVLFETGRVLLGLPLAEAAAVAWAVGQTAPDAPALENLFETSARPVIATADDRLESHGRVLSGQTAWLPNGGPETTHLLTRVRNGDLPALVLAQLNPEVASWTPVLVADRTRQYARARIDQAPVTVLADGDRAENLWLRVRAFAALLSACEAVGAAEALLERSVAYARLREQFGRPIGAFQAVKHRLADMLIDVERSRAAVLHTLALSPESAPFVTDAAAARVVSGNAFVAVAQSAIQVHGGLAYTWELPVHLYYRRAATDRVTGWPLAEAAAHLRSQLFGRLHA